MEAGQVAGQYTRTRYSPGLAGSPRSRTSVMDDQRRRLLVTIFALPIAVAQLPIRACNGLLLKAHGLLIDSL